MPAINNGAMVLPKIVVQTSTGPRVMAVTPPRPFSTLSENVLLDTADLCQLFATSPRTIYRWISEGRLSNGYQLGRSYFFRKKIVLAIEPPARGRRPQFPAPPLEPE